MAAAGRVRSEDQFLCSICLDVFTDPVTIPCGHNFCRSCISEHWRVNFPYQCPMCKKAFDPRPELYVNTFIKEMVAQFRHEAQQEEQKADLKKTEAEIQQMIQERRLKIQEIQQSVELSKNAADRETAEASEVFTALMESVQKSLKKLKEEIQEKLKTTEKQAEDFIKELEQEICELEKRSAEVEQLSGSEDQLHWVQTFTAVKSAPPTKTWEKVSVCPPAYEDTVVRTVNQLEDELRRVMRPVKDKLRSVQQFEVDVTLDPDTAQSDLRLSEDRKQVHHAEYWCCRAGPPQRFSDSPSVLGKQSFSSGRFYFEVQVDGVTHWTLGVAKESINRKQTVIHKPKKGSWTIGLRNGDTYLGFDSPPVDLQLESGPQKVGVFVDYEEGLVSFYDVDTTDLIYSMTECCFREKLHPYFNIEEYDSPPLIITPVRKTLC